MQYYDCAAVCSIGRGVRELSTALKNLLDSFGTLKSNRREISARRILRCRAQIRGRTGVPKAMLYATQMRAGD